MHEGLSNDRLWATFWIGLICAMILKRELPFAVCLLVSFVKASIPFVYFAWFFDGSWTMFDDIHYRMCGEQMLQDGYNSITALVDPKGLERLFDLSGGIHILYGWWNPLGQYLFGEHYYSAVFLNVGLTAVCGVLLVHILSIIGFDKIYRRSFFIIISAPAGY